MGSSFIHLTDWVKELLKAERSLLLHPVSDACCSRLMGLTCGVPATKKPSQPWGRPPRRCDWWCTEMKHTTGMKKTWRFSPWICRRRLAEDWAWASLENGKEMVSVRIDQPCSFRVLGTKADKHWKIKPCINYKALISKINIFMTIWMR